MPDDDRADAAQRRLHAIDAEIETTRRRLWAVEHGLELVDDAIGEADCVRARLTELGDQFLVAYREWQAAEGENARAPTAKP